MAADLSGTRKHDNRHANATDAGRSTREKRDGTAAVAATAAERDKSDGTGRSDASELTRRLSMSFRLSTARATIVATLRRSIDITVSGRGNDVAAVTIASDYRAIGRIVGKVARQ